MHLSPELEWAQFLVIMVIGLMLLYDCVLSRKHSRKMEGLLNSDGEELWADVEGYSSSMDVPTERSGGAGLRFAVEQGQADLSRRKQGFLGGMEPPTYYPTLSEDRDKHRALAKRKTDAYMSKYSTAFDRALKKGLSPERADAQARRAAGPGRKSDAKFQADVARYKKQMAKKAARSGKEGMEADLESHLEYQLRE